MTERIVEAVARHAEMDTLDLDVPLYDVIDPDALDALFAHDSANVSVEFSYLGYLVSVDENSDVTVRNTDSNGHQYSVQDV